MAKKRISLTLEEEIVEKIDSEADSHGFNRSQMIETIVEEYFSGKSVDTAVVLCGDESAKSLEEYEGEPVLKHIIRHISGQGVERAVLLAGRNKEIEEEFGDSCCGLDIEYVYDIPKGTGAALSKVEGMVDSTFAVLNGHVITDVDLREMSEHHRNEDLIATMALTTVDDPSKYGVARLKGSKILGFEEKPEQGEEPSRLINAGTYIFEPEVFDILDYSGLDDFFESLASQKSLAGYIYGGEWLDLEEN